jgi:hypothetical protein
MQITKRLLTVSKLLLLSFVALSSCATIYQKEGLFTNGYSDLRSGQDIFVVTFRANEHTPVKKVKKYALRRAAEVTRKHGYRYFAILDETGEAKHLHYPSLRLTIQCFHERPFDREVIDSAQLV